MDTVYIFKRIKSGPDIVNVWVAGGERGEILLGQGPNIAAGASCNPGHVHLMHLFILKNCSEKKTCQHKLPVFPKE
jgi:hypothetical protein